MLQHSRPTLRVDAIFSTPKVELSTLRGDVAGYALRTCPLVKASSNLKAPIPNAQVALEWPSAHDILELHNRQMDQLDQLTNDLGVPAVVAGDFNAPPLSPRFPPDGLVDAFKAAGLGPGATYPAPFPLWRIDGVLTTRDLEPTGSSVVKVSNCDHRAVVVDLCFEAR